MSKNPVVKKDDGWYFYAEDWFCSYGPYSSEAEAEEALNEYAECLNEVKCNCGRILGCRVGVESQPRLRIDAMQDDYEVSYPVEAWCRNCNRWWHITEEGVELVGGPNEMVEEADDE